MTLVLLIAILLLFLGIIGSVLPFLPGPPLSWVGLLIYGFYTGFEKISVAAVVIFGILALISILLDFFAPALGAKGYKASRSGIIGAILGGFLGVLVFGPIGVVIGPLLGAFIGEYVSNRDRERAYRVAVGSFVGVFIGTLAKLLLTLAMAIYFVWMIV